MRDYFIQIKNSECKKIVTLKFIDFFYKRGSKRCPNNIKKIQNQTTA